MFDVILQVGFFPSMPLLATLLIAIDVVVLFALTARWDEAKPAAVAARLEGVAGSDALLLDLAGREVRVTSPEKVAVLRARRDQARPRRLLRRRSPGR